MTRIIKASEVKPGMEVEFTTVRKVTVNKIITWRDGRRELRDGRGNVAIIATDAPVTVLSEPQPEEPTAGGARVVVDGRRFLRADNDSLPWVELDVWDWHTWDSLCEMGPVQVIPDQGWTVPEAPEVPDRIEEWPEDDTALRAHEWMDRLGSVWRYEHTGTTTGWGCPGMSPQYQPWGSPFTRVIDARASAPGAA